MKSLRFFFFSCMAAAVFVPAPGVAQKGNSLKVQTVSGWIEGVGEPSGVRSFKGIPYAAPPVDSLRWCKPQPVVRWSGVRKAVQFGPRAMQTAIFGDMVFRSGGVSEDCLYLNIWAPQKGKKLLPVLVYFYGGGFVAGDGSELRYDGESMAQQGMVAITVNYRLGIFGFFAHPALTRESPQRASGNYGLLDQAAALQWVQQNIAAFGGDPKRITIAGESAGSVSVSALMVSPLAKALIAGAIGESGSVLGTLPPLPLGNCEKTGVAFAESLGASSLKALRSLPADSLLNASARFGLFRFTPALDGYFFPKAPLEVFARGEQAKVPLLAGWNSEESSYRAVLGNVKPTREAFATALQKLYGSRAGAVLKAYYPATDSDVAVVATALASDRFIGFSTWRWANMHSKTSGQPVYRYFYEHPRPGGNGAVHSAEIEYALGNLSTNKVFAWTEDDYAVSRMLQSYFAQFIKTGNPNGSPEGLYWPPANGTTGVPVLHMDVQPQVKPEQHRERYLLLEEIAAEENRRP